MAELIPITIAGLFFAFAIAVYLGITKRDRSLDDHPYGDTTGWRERK